MARNRIQPVTSGREPRLLSWTRPLHGQEPRTELGAVDELPLVQDLELPRPVRGTHLRAARPLRGNNRLPALCHQRTDNLVLPAPGAWCQHDNQHISNWVGLGLMATSTSRRSLRGWRVCLRQGISGSTESPGTSSSPPRWPRSVSSAMKLKCAGVRAVGARSRPLTSGGIRSWERL